MRVGDVTGNTPLDGNSKSRGGKSRSPDNGKGDTLEISGNGRGKTAHDSRKLAEIQKNIKNGVYIKPALTKAIVEKLLGANALGKEKDTDDTVAQCCDEYEDIPDIRKDRVEEARKKVSSDGYSDSKILERIVDRILEQFGIR
ncbi:MAG: hypothetical protein KAT85_03040 [candidate division Zixibacteria bacterium]|jgi:hypothetical protein|nr:hypothetical protein [candidate division Zixibacteria bacterium]